MTGLGALLATYFAVLALLAGLGAYRLHLTVAVLRARRRRGGRAPDPPLAPPAASQDARPWPTVVVQLPLYDESLVAERVLRAAARLSYPRDCLEVQVLDDSTDETRVIVDRVAAEIAREGTRVSVLRRGERSGFKAGALAFGLARTQADLVAIFDADFVPPPDFLERTVAHLVAHPERAMVQARWGHLNRRASLLTRAQAIFLDGHFAIDHGGRSALGRFFNFNGTAGVWRRSAIVAAGGWSADTLTEDLDLSCRAQLAGARFAYLHDVVAPAELPESWRAFRTQQARWVRGSIETARKHLPALLAAGRLPRAVRVDAAVHLLSNLAYLLMALLAVLLPVVVVARAEVGWRVPGGEPLLAWLDTATLFFGTFAMSASYLAAAAEVEGRLRPARCLEILLALAIGAGMSISNAREVLRALRGRAPALFIRTLKHGDAPTATAVARYGVQVGAPASGVLVALELALAATFLAVAIYAIHAGRHAALPFLILYLVGFAAVSSGTLWESAALRRLPPRLMGSASVSR